MNIRQNTCECVGIKTKFLSTLFLYSARFLKLEINVLFSPLRFHNEHSFQKRATHKFSHLHTFQHIVAYICPVDVLSSATVDRLCRRE